MAVHAPRGEWRREAESFPVLEKIISPFSAAKILELPPKTIPSTGLPLSLLPKLRSKKASSHGQLIASRLPEIEVSINIKIDINIKTTAAVICNVLLIFPPD
jgi:hypothetical protein